MADVESELEAVEKEIEATPDKEKKKLEELEAKLELLTTEKQIKDREAEIRRLKEEVHPSKIRKLESLLGKEASAAYKALRATPEVRAERKEKLKHAIEKLREITPKPPEAAATTMAAFAPPAIAKPEEAMSAADQFVVSIRKMRGY